MVHIRYFENFQSSVEDYLKQTISGNFECITRELYDYICEEGFVDDLEKYYNEEYDIDDFEYMLLNISDEDKVGIINNDDDIVEKFNDFDIKLKFNQYGYTTVCDFIDYEKGIVYIVRLIQ